MDRQWKAVPKRKGARTKGPCAVLTLGTDRVISLFDLSDGDGSDMAIME